MAPHPCHQLNHGSLWDAAPRAAVRRHLAERLSAPSRAAVAAKVPPIAAVLLAVGLLVAIVTDGALPGAATKGLLAVLGVLDMIVAFWLTRPR